MALYRVFSHPVRHVYKASLCSSAVFTRLLGFLIIVICPLLVAYRTNGFWLKTVAYRETPQVTFKHQFLLLLHTNSPTELIFWSSYPWLNSLVSENLRVPTVRSIEADGNRNGVADSLQFHLSMPLAKNENVLGLRCFLIFDYRLELHSRFQMETLMELEKSGYASGSSGLQIAGDLRLFQREPLQYRGVDQRYNTPIIDRFSFPDSPDLISGLLDSYASRNVSTRLENVFSVWRPGPPANEQFQLDLTVRFTEEEIIRRTGFWEMLKWGWIQYLSILIVFYAVVTRLWEFVFSNRLVMCVQVDPIQAAAKVLKSGWINFTSTIDSHQLSQKKNFWNWSEPT